MWTELNGEILVLSEQANQDKGTRKLFAGKVSVVTDTSDLDPANKVDLRQTSQKLQALGDKLNQMFVARADLIDAILLGFASGEHVFVKSAPGTAKTDIASQATKAISGQLWDILFNQDLDRNSIYGPIDAPHYDKTGEWRRNWSALATAQVALLDEVWKGSGQNNNLLLDGLNERVAREANEKISIPLHMAIGASNETPEDDERQAIYDRFMIRLTLGYMDNIGDFENMLIADGSTIEIAPTINIDELTLMAAAAELMALTPPDDLMANIKELWSELQTEHGSVSDRRWRKTLKLACAQALLLDEPVNGSHISIAKYTLWQSEDEERSLKKLVATLADPLAGELLDIEAQMADLRKGIKLIQAEQDTAKQIEMKSDYSNKSGRAGKALSELAKQNGAAQHSAKIESLIKQSNELQKDILFA